MLKLHKYRPLSEFLFKELYYQELFFASYTELNDPFDLSARIEFTPESEDQLEYLIWFIFKTTLVLEKNLSQKKIENNESLTSFTRNESECDKFKKNIYDELLKLKKGKKHILYKHLEFILKKVVEDNKLNFTVDYLGLEKEINRITKKFFESSYTTCFSATNSNFLMWSHYASKHSGICLEFSLEHDGLFPYMRYSNRVPDYEKYKKRMSEWEIQAYCFWDRVKQVTYRDEQPCINFFDFSPVFENEDDCDLIGLSKAKWHGFAYELENVFSSKTNAWSYEKEWRAIQINLGDPIEPEERIRHYPIECLTGIYFGNRTPQEVKHRINKIYSGKNTEVKLHDCELAHGSQLTFKAWEPI